MSTIKLIHDSCVNQHVDAVVNAANRDLLPGGGICGVIFDMAGYSGLMDECKKINTPLNNGECVITSSCNMENCKYIIHAVGPDFSENINSFSELFDAYYNSLCILKENNLHSISFPLISAGIFGYGLENPPLESAKRCTQAYQYFTKENPNYNIDVILCAYSDNEMIEATKEFNLYNFVNSEKNRKKELTKELTNELIYSIDYNNIVAIKVSECGAMGEPNCFCAVDKNLNLYHTNFSNQNIDHNKFRNKFTILNNISCSMEHMDLFESDWGWFNMGFGNYLLVRDKYLNEVKNFITTNLGVDYEHTELYQRWYYCLKIILMNISLQ